MGCECSQSTPAYIKALFTRFYSNNFVIFVALAVLHSHRDVLIRYLQEFDEVLKYANDLTGTVRRHTIVR
jgi:hypothetical protein